MEFSKNKKGSLMRFPNIENIVSVLINFPEFRIISVSIILICIGFGVLYWYLKNKA